MRCCRKGAYVRGDHQFTKDDQEVIGGQTGVGEAKRDDHNFSYVGAWEYTAVGQKPTLHKEPLVFENVVPSIRSYK